MGARAQIADFLSALITVYTLIIFASIIVSWIFSFGVRVPYSRPLNAVLDFLRDVTNPYLRIFRRLGLQIGPMDLSPIPAILVLGVVGQMLLVPAIRGGARAARSCSPRWSRWGSSSPIRSRRRSCAQS